MDNFHINSTDIALHKIMIEAPICNMDSRTSTGFVFISSSMRVIFSYISESSNCSNVS